MDKRDLIEYSNRQVEVKNLRKRKEQKERELSKLNSMVVVDSVACGKKGNKPLRTVKIQGQPTLYIAKKQSVLERDIKRLELMEEELLELQTKAEEYIDSIEKSELRTMFRLFFLDDLSYAKTAMELNRLHPKRKVKYTDENVKKKIQRFLKKN